MFFICWSKWLFIEEWYEMLFGKYLKDNWCTKKKIKDNWFYQLFYLSLMEYVL